MSNKYFDGEILPGDVKEPVDDDLINTALTTVETIDNLIKQYRMSDALDALFNLARRCNKYIDETAPWVLAKDPEKKGRLGTVLYNLLEGIRFTAVLLAPFMPDTSKKIFEQLNCDVTDYESLKTFGGTKVGGKVGTPVPLFSRIDAEKMLKEIAEKQEEAAKKAYPKSDREEKKAELEGIAQIGIEDFCKVDLRVAEIKACEPVKKAKKLLKLTLDDGAGERTVASGIAKFYKPEDLIGHRVVLVSNLKPAKLCGVESCGMILAATCGEEVKVIFVDDMTPGSKIS